MVSGTKGADFAIWRSIRCHAEHRLEFRAGEQQRPRPHVTRTIDDGFDLGSAAIGAGSAAAILLIGGAGATAASRHRRRVRSVG